MHPACGGFQFLISVNGDSDTTSFSFGMCSFLKHGRGTCWWSSMSLEASVVQLKKIADEITCEKSPPFWWGLSLEGLLWYLFIFPGNSLAAQKMIVISWEYSTDVLEGLAWHVCFLFGLHKFEGKGKYWIVFPFPTHHSYHTSSISHWQVYFGKSKCQPWTKANLNTSLIPSRLVPQRFYSSNQLKVPYWQDI